MVAVNLKEKFRNGELDLSSCGLKEIPKDITTLKHITSLDLSNNKIASVGKIIGTLTHLQKLNLSKNHIKGLPENIGNLTNLKHLDLSNNQLATLPITIGNLKNLKCLVMKNNPLAPKFSEIVGTSFQNENQCQQAAKNVLKAFGSNTDGDKKKKQNTDSKKNKNDRKAQNGGVSQKSKERKNKKSNKGFVAEVLSTTIAFIRMTLFVLVVLSLGLYYLSFTDQNRYNTIKGMLLPIWQSACSRVLTPDQTALVETKLLLIGYHINQIVVNTSKMLLASWIRFYTYVKTDENIQRYVNATTTWTKELYTKICLSTLGEQSGKC